MVLACVSSKPTLAVIVLPVIVALIVPETPLMPSRKTPSSALVYLIYLYDAPGSPSEVTWVSTETWSFRGSHCAGLAACEANPSPQFSPSATACARVEVQTPA